MNVSFKKMALAFGILALTTSCATTSNPEAKQEQVSQGTEVKATEKVDVVNIDGSSTVYPITANIAKQFQAQSKGAQVSVKFSGTSAGFEKFCAGEIDISNASRPILKEEMEACNKNNIRFMEIPVAFDALTLAVNPQNTWAKDITVAELKKMWEPAAQGKITRWNQIRPSYPDKPLTLYGAGNKSGTFDYFTEAIVGKQRASRTDYTASEDDVTLVRGVINDANALGYFGFAYYEDNQSKLKALAIDSGKGAFFPSRESVEKAQYQPLSRPLLIYISVQAAQNKPDVKDFVDFYIQQAPRTVSAVGYIPLPGEGYQLASNHFNKGKVGTVFEGKETLNLTIGELLRKQSKF